MKRDSVLGAAVADVIYEARQKSAELEWRRRKPKCFRNPQRRHSDAVIDADGRIWVRGEDGWYGRDY